MKRKQLTEEENEFGARIIDVLQESHMGRENFITASALAERVGWYESDGTHARMRAIITEMIERGIPIGSCSRGFFFVANEEEMIWCRNSYFRRAMEVQHRGEAIDNAYRTYYE